ncbi:MAG: type III glutamate--ammonia ligase [Rhodospirillales bacterium]|nr:type III glutamate--ammonia ligase [Rhodospirillales bacterium]
MRKTGNPSIRSDLAALRESLISGGVRFLLPSYVDMHGVSKSKMVPIEHFDRAMAGSELCTGAALDGVPQSIHDDEVAAHPDPGSCTIQPWMPEVAWFASDLHCKGKPFEACSRNILNRVIASANGHGFGMNLGVEAEFFVFRDDPGTDGCQPMSPRHNLDKPAYDAARLLDNAPWIGELVTAMNDLGWDVYSFDHEDGIGQFEIDFSYSDVLTTADRFVFFRRLANEIARKHGGYASFMPKPMGHYAGSGAHYNISLFDAARGTNLFEDNNDPRGCGLSALGYRFIAGLLHHMPTISAVVAPTVNSYKRLILKGSNSGFTWAPVFCSYGDNNRTNTVRIPLGGGRVELRLADSSCNPYLGAAMVLAAGLEGIEQERDPGAPHTENLYIKSDEELRALGVTMLPRTLGEALDAFAASDLARATFGADMFEAWLAYKRDEWLCYLNHVSDWERARYLKFF